MTTKVKKVDSYEDSQGKHIVAKGKLILIKDTRDTCTGLIRCIKDRKAMFPEDNCKVGDICIGRNISSGVFGFWEPIKPIIISETEETEVGDWVYHHVKGTYQAKVDGNYCNCFKILVLPEQFTKAHLQAIIDSKMKDGDEVYVECEDIWVKVAHSLDVAYQVELHLPEPGHVKLFPVKKEEKSREEMIAAFYKIAEIVDFERPENKDLFDIIYPFLEPVKR